MSEFGLFIEKIESVKNHPNADRLDLAVLEGKFFQFVTGKDLYKAGDMVLYFPVDSLIPTEHHALLGVEGRLSGSKKERVKTVKLRGEFSQGLVAPVSIIESLPWRDFAASKGFGSVVEAFDLFAFCEASVSLGIDLAELFGLTKYEPPVQMSGGPNLAGRSIDLPEGIRKYDIESAQRYKTVIDQLDSENIAIRVTEKLEGTHATFKKYAQEDRFDVCSRTRTWSRIFDQDGNPMKNTYLDVFENDLRIKTLLEQVEKDHDAKLFCAIRGEIVGEGIQGNIYQIKGNKFYLFDILVDGQYLPEIELKKYQDMIDLVPIVYSGFVESFLEFSEKENIVAAANGKTILDCPQKGKILREGIVIKPYFKEMRDEKLGRVILKVRDLEYLEKTGH